ncbi:DUF3137 domain-containing protein [Anabaena cylindrica FACHB-243]|uniref:Galanin n=1 Tax=Anabaena cylindrica (strain ATCC 27899 / PCC 7122) TaxID=272123 RepID=K9ZH20_ANACC|nr:MULTISPECIES: DUF3137 domain-containing protein [Anabaena]AFZ58533.1 hypothetical protein Anacy_3121 [Anabaena cylindrica PCC 7122]MBD2416296.1 DUF3137 domain-containing protein [Anabaena cylindrica FACHB-243]MBY5283285.1 DUF3137 domain-containing protein [Anabaena sp. CCAP 1446/1C]MBY5307966.1 DUF3137 domain-containing protein [Anabaena sp. CCAP 1446/1C]MCM2407323.1 DUF3137 domain-containing protein [Anabaena sp. CCAP 1446/1C]
MSTNELKILQTGLNSLKQGLYPEAINSLQHFCQICEVSGNTNSKEYLQAQVGLVQAFHHTKNSEAARTIAQKLLTIQNPQIIAWARKFLESLPVETSSKTSTETNSRTVESTLLATTKKPTLTPEKAEELLNNGNKALKFQHYAEAVQALEEFCQCADDQVKHYNQAQMWLVKAYKGNEQLEEAIALCKQLTTSQQASTNLWATKFLVNLVPESEIPQESTTQATNSVQSQSSSTSRQGSVVEIKMKTLEEFKSFCQQNLLTDLQDLESVRKQVLISIVVVGVIVAVIFLADIKFLLLHIIMDMIIIYKIIPLELIFLFLFIFLGCLWGWIAFYTSCTETYASGFKSKIIQKIFDFINYNQSLSYYEQPSAEDDRYVMSGFAHSQMFQTLLKANKITQNDCIFGKVGEIPIYFSEISAQFEIQHTWSRYFDFAYHMKVLALSNIPKFIRRMIFGLMLPFYIIILIFQTLKGTPYVFSKMIRGKKIDYQSFKEEVLNNEVTRKLIFKGLFFQANFPKTLKSKTIVVPNLVNININALPQTTRQLVKLEDPNFNQYFTVYANDQVEARYVLSTTLMEKLVKFRQKAHRNIYVSFIDNMIYIGIEYAGDIFEPRLFTTMLNFTPMREYFQNIQLMLGIVEDLNLNRRIWQQN